MHFIATVLWTAITLHASPAQDMTAQFRWKAGATLTYHAEHVTEVSETIDGKKSSTKSKLRITKRWHVQSVDEQGNAVLELKLAAMRNEQVAPSGATLIFDSQKPEDSTPELRDALKRYIGVTLAVVRVDPTGKVIDVRQGDAARLEAEPPFGVVLPTTPIQGSTKWNRTYGLQLPPPRGTGETYKLTQNYECASVEDGVAVIRLTTVLQDKLQVAADEIPLLPSMPQGEVHFDLKSGCMLRAQLQFSREIRDHQGSGSIYRFESNYTEVLESPQN